MVTVDEVKKFEERILAARRNCRHPDEERHFDWETAWEAGACYSGTVSPYYCGLCGSNLPDNTSFMSNLGAAAVGVLVLVSLGMTGILGSLLVYGLMLFLALAALGLIMTAVGWIAAVCRFLRRAE